MATRNGVSSTNNVNVVMWTYSTQLDFHTDRKTTSSALHALLVSVANLGVGVTAASPFTIYA